MVDHRPSTIFMVGATHRRSNTLETERSPHTKTFLFHPKNRISVKLHNCPLFTALSSRVHQVELHLKERTHSGKWYRKWARPCSTLSEAEEKGKFNRSQSVLGAKTGEQTTKCRLLLLEICFSFGPRTTEPFTSAHLSVTSHLALPPRPVAHRLLLELVFFPKGNTPYVCKSAWHSCRQSEGRVHQHVKNRAELESLFAFPLDRREGFNYFCAGYRQDTVRCDK